MITKREDIALAVFVTGMLIGGGIISVVINSNLSSAWTIALLTATFFFTLETTHFARWIHYKKP